MPVDHPDKPLERRAPAAHIRKINFALGFLITLGLLLVLVPIVSLAAEPSGGDNPCGAAAVRGAVRDPHSVLGMSSV